jgi:hypothetical protein
MQRRRTPTSDPLLALKGVDISPISPVINAQLDSQLLRSQDATDQFGADRLQSIRRYITEEYPEKQERGRTLILRPKPKPPKPQPFSEQDSDSIVEAILDGDRSQSVSIIGSAKHFSKGADQPSAIESAVIFGSIGPWGRVSVIGRKSRLTTF